MYFNSLYFKTAFRKSLALKTNYKTYFNQQNDVNSFYVQVN